MSSKAILRRSIATGVAVLLTVLLSKAIIGSRHQTLGLASELVAFHNSMLTANVMGSFPGDDARLPQGLLTRGLTSIPVASFTAQGARVWSPFGYALGTTLDVRQSGDRTWSVSRSICYGFGAWTRDVGVISN